MIYPVTWQRRLVSLCKICTLLCRWCTLQGTRRTWPCPSTISTDWFALKVTEATSPSTGTTLSETSVSISHNYSSFTNVSHTLSDKTLTLNKPIFEKLQKAFNSSKLFDMSSCAFFSWIDINISVADPWTPYWSHVNEGWNLKSHKNVLFLFYEEMNKVNIYSFKWCLEGLG